MSEPDPDVQAVAYAIAKVIATKTIAADTRLRNLDALGRVTAAHTMALRMVPELQEEATAALNAAKGLLLAHAGGGDD